MGVVLVGRADGGGRGAGGTRKGLRRLWVGVRETFGMEVEVGESIRLGREALGRVFSGDWAEECGAGYKDRRRLQWSLCGRKWEMCRIQSWWEGPVSLDWYWALSSCFCR